jgi:hypothetical protein
MNTRISRIRRSVSFLLLGAGSAALAGSIALAQAPSPVQLATEYGEKAKANAALMKQYSWQMRVQMTAKGEQKPASIYQMRYDVSGDLQKTLLTAPPEEKKHGLRGKIEEDKMKEFKDWADGLMDLLKKYMAPTPGTMMDFYSKAVSTPADPGMVKVSGSGFVQPGDSITYVINSATKSPLRFSFKTAYKGDPVECKVILGQVEGGPQYAGKTSVSVPAKDVSATIENFNFIKQ